MHITFYGIQYGTGELLFALCKLCYMLVHFNTDDLKFALWKVLYKLLHYRTGDLQFSMWKLHCTLLQCTLTTGSLHFVDSVIRGLFQNQLPIGW